MNRDILTAIFAIVTTVPAIAWHVNAIIQIRKYYKDNQTEIDKTTKEKTEALKKTAEKLSENLEKTVKETLYKSPSDDPKASTQPGAEDRS